MFTKFRDIVVARITQKDYIVPLCCLLNKMDIYPEGFICSQHLGEMYDTFENQETYFRHWDLTTWLNDPFKIEDPQPWLISAAPSSPLTNASHVDSLSATPTTGKIRDTSFGK